MDRYHKLVTTSEMCAVVLCNPKNGIRAELLTVLFTCHLMHQVKFLHLDFTFYHAEIIKLLL